MKSLQLLRTAGWRWVLCLALCFGVRVLKAAETNATEKAAEPAGEKTAEKAAAPLTPEQMFEGGAESYNNWIEFAIGGFITQGSQAQFQQFHQNSGGPFGGISDFHYLANVNKTTTLAIDGRALFDEHDYKLSLDLTKEKTGYLRFNYRQFRTWYDGDGGFYPPTAAYYSRSGDALGLDRGEISFEGGLTLENAPKVVFNYTHTFREGEKDSTSWGPVHPTGSAVTRAISPTLDDINEHSDAFRLDVSHHIKATDFGAGIRYETGKLDDALKIDQFRNEPTEQKITDRQGTTYDMFNVHAFSETWFNKDLMFSSGFSYCDLDNEFSGSRIYGSDFDVGYVPAAQNGFGYYGLSGGSRLDEYVVDLNLLTRPIDHFTIVPSVRMQKEDWDANSSGLETLGAFAPVPFAADSSRGLLDLRERLDLTYNGVTNWVFYGRGEFDQTEGNLNQNGGLVPINGTGVLPVQNETDDHRLSQKYSIGARWYPTRRVIVDGGGYYKDNRYDYNNEVDSTPNNSFDRYPGYLVMQDFQTYDGNIRLTLRPIQNVSLITRYEFQWSTIDTRPGELSGLPEVQSSEMTSHIIAQDISWSPWSRLYLQVGFNYVLSTAHTPASDVTQAILQAQNDYWTLNFSSGIVLDDRTDIKLGYFYYRAADYTDNSSIGLPLGSGAQEQAVSATLTRRIRKNLRWSLKYAYSQYDDDLYGGHRDFNAHMVYSSLQYRF